ncbi:hypothetical protein L7F22_038291 [Adiantum nelumboides]|nr:hypothetical protein [Adiantum nelumboides]
MWRRGSLANENTAGSALANFPASSASLTASNVGFRLLQKAGWREGSGLGVSEQGRLEPVDVFVKNDKRGLGAKVICRKMVTRSNGAPEILKAKGTEGNKKRVISRKALKKLKKESEVERRLQEQLLQPWEEKLKRRCIYWHNGIRDLQYPRRTWQVIQWVQGLPSSLAGAFTFFDRRKAYS